MQGSSCRTWTSWTILASLALGHPHTVSIRHEATRLICEAHGDAYGVYFPKRLTWIWSKLWGQLPFTSRTWDWGINSMMPQGLPECGMVNEQLTWFLHQVTDLKRMGGQGQGGRFSIKTSRTRPWFVFWWNSHVKWHLWDNQRDGIRDGYPMTLGNYRLVCCLCKQIF